MPLDVLPVFSILDRITDANGEPVSGGYAEFYDAGTTTPRTVYSDSGLSVSLGTVVYADTGGYPVSTQGGSTKVSVYTGTGAFKVIVKDSAGTTLITRDNIPGALDTSAFTTTSAVPDTPTVSKTAAYSVVVGDAGKLINANCTGGSFVITLPSAVTAGDGFRIGIRHAGTANTVTISTVSSQTIAQPGPATQNLSLTGRGETYWLVSDGANWTIDTAVPSLMRNGVPFITIADRLSAPPGSPTAGARYIVGSSPTGAWSTLSFSEHDVAEADGNGSWIKYTPTDGWLAYVIDENLLTQYRDTAWTDLSNTTAPDSANLEYAIFADQKADGAVGGMATVAAWTKRTLNTTIANTITGCSLASSVVTLPTGTYLVWAIAYQQRTNGAGVSILQGASTRHYGLPGSTAADSANLPIFAVIVVAGASDTIELDYYAQTSNTTTDLGAPLSLSGNLETYAMMTILNLSSMQGPQGEQGTQGTDGLDAAHPYQWSTSTGDPGTGKFGVNNANPTLATVINVSETDSAGGPMASVLDTWDDSTSSVRAVVKFSKEGATQNFYEYQITGAQTDNGTYRSFPVTFVGPASGTSLSNGDAGALIHLRTGDKGDTGATGSAATASFEYTFSTSTGTGPSTGTVRANNANLSLATALYIHETDRLGISQAAAIAQWDDSTTTAHRGYLTLVDVATPANKTFLEITGANTDNGSDQTIVVTYVSGATSLTAVNVQIIWARTGDKGADGAGSGDFVGPGSSTDNALVRFDGTTGKLGQNSTVTISDTGTIAGVQAITLSANDAGALGASGTAFADLFLASGGVINWNAGDVTATHSANALAFAGASSGYSFDAAALPSANDAAALGASGTAWADLFLASGAVINFNAGDVTVTHSANTLAFGGASSGYTFDAAATVTSAGANALAVGANGTTNPALKVDASAASVATGISITGAAAASRASIAVLSSGTDEGISIDAKGAGTIRLGATSTGAIELSRNIVPTASDGAALGTSALMFADLFLASGGVINFNAGDVTVTHSANTLAFGGASSGYTFDAATTPSTNDAAALGSATVSWADLFLASGAVINFNNGNVTLTHSAATLTMAGATSLAMGTSIAVGLGTIEIGHASDTTLSRSSAGVLAVEGVTVSMNSTSATHTAGTIELGAASDTTLARASAGVMSVEGKTVATLSTSQAWTAHQYVTLGTLTDGANISWDVSTAQKAKVTLGGNRTMNAVSNAVEGATYTLWVIQDGTGSRTISWTTSGAGSFDFGTDGAPTLTTTASRADLLAFEAISIGGTLKLRYMGIKKGFA